MTERCPDCGRPFLVDNMSEPDEAICFMREMEDRLCIKLTRDRLKTQAQRNQETIAVARKCIEAADELPDFIDRTISADDDGYIVVTRYELARAEFAKVEGEPPAKGSDK